MKVIQLFLVGEWCIPNSKDQLFLRLGIAVSHAGWKCHVHCVAVVNNETRSEACVCQHDSGSKPVDFRIKQDFFVVFIVSLYVTKHLFTELSGNSMFWDLSNVYVFLNFASRNIEDLGITNILFLSGSVNKYSLNYV